MYFISRAWAGQKLAEKLTKYRYENVIAIAINDSSVLVAAEISSTLHCGLGAIAFEEVEVPGESQTFGTVDHQGGFSINQEFSKSQVDDYYAEYHSSIDQQRLEKFKKLNRLLADGGMIDKEILRYHTIIVVADGIKETIMLDAVEEFLKRVRIEKLVVACPIASVEAVDKMHILADEIQCLSVTDNFLDVNHYYDINEDPKHARVVEMINQNILNWR